jgi:hypothetical protein
MYDRRIKPGLSAQTYAGREGRREIICPVAKSWYAAYAGVTVEQPFINCEEKIDRFVGKRTKTPDGFRAGMKLQETTLQLHRAFKHRWAAKGVYRFKTHEEADAWMTKMLARSGMSET